LYSENSLYLAKIPESSASCLDSMVNVYMIVNEWDAKYHFDFNKVSQKIGKRKPGLHHA